ncbi:MAG TPA: AMP-binding protein [Candidatus Brevibacterium intestinigallinarum]|nr:AMP-binding protein [Candidatus Brevibacterium intestinigallinarum]
MTTAATGTAELSTGDEHPGQRRGYYPAHMPEHLDYVPAAVPEILLSAAKRHPDRIAFVDGEDALTFAQLRDRALRLAARLAADGAGPGRVVGIQLPNVLDFPVAYFGVLLTGAAVTLVNPLQPAPALARQLSDAGAHLLIVHPAHLAAAREAAPELDLSRVLVTEPSWAGTATEAEVAAARDLTSDAAQPVFVPFAEAVAGSDTPAFSPVLVDEGEVAHFQFTGGTTGRSKAVRVLHRNVIGNLTQASAWRLHSRIVRDADGDLALEPIEELGAPLLVPGEGVSIQVPPLFHAQGISSVAMFVLGGITTVLTGRFRPDTFLDLCDRWQAQYTSGNPPMYLALAAHSAQTGRQATTVRAALSGAAPLDATSLSKIATVMPNAVVGEGYGLTEGTCIVTASDLTPGGVRRAGTVGVPIPDTEVEIRSADGAQVLPAGTEGELWVRGPQVTDGYHGAPELTAAQYVDGWLRTGDVASVDAEGFIRIHDRAKDMLLYKGYNVYPRELEDIVTAHPRVAQAAVVGRPDADVGEIPVAFIVPRPAPEAAEAAAAGNAEAPGQSDSGQSDSAAQDEALVAEIMDWFAQQVLPYQKIREVHLVDALPTSTAGKVLKTELRTRL